MTDKLNLQRLDHDPRLPMRGSIDFERVLYVRLYELFRAIAGVTNQNGEAINNALNTKANAGTRIIAGTGLTGGGTLAANRTLSISTSHTPVGVEQTWQTPSRSMEVTYTNTTGRAIEWAVTGYADRHFIMVIDGLQVGVIRTTGATTNASATYIVPNGSTYRINHGETGAGGFNTWRELR